MRMSIQKDIDFSQRQIKGWGHFSFYNRSRPHQGLDYRTPVDVYKATGKESLEYIDLFGGWPSRAYEVLGN